MSVALELVSEPRACLMGRVVVCTKCKCLVGAATMYLLVACNNGPVALVLPGP
jgi:hypothetical protein